MIIKKELERIERKVDEAIEKIIHDPSEAPAGAINWGDLGVVYASYHIVNEVYGLTLETHVLISEADPSNPDLREAILSLLPDDLAESLHIDFEW